MSARTQSSLAAMAFVVVALLTGAACALADSSFARALVSAVFEALP